MPCYNPLLLLSAKATPFAGSFSHVKVPCGQCIGCRLERSRVWAMRCVHEASLHESNCFLTLTYDDAHLPVGNTLVKRHFQLFMKRLRKFAKCKISFFHCGEYGERSGRPHYHALIFGYDFPDKVLRPSSGEDKLFRSESLDCLWGLGFCSIGAVSFESAAYCARYCLKKITGDTAAAHYGDRLAEYMTCSLKPAIGRNWYLKYSGEVSQNDSVVMRGREMRPPRYYDKVLEAVSAEAYKALKLVRVRKAIKYRDNNTPERLKVRSVVAAGKLSLLKRSVE